MPTRRFPPPWSVDELNACFIVKDSAWTAFDNLRLRPSGKELATLNDAYEYARKLIPQCCMMINMTGNRMRAHMD